MTLKLILPLLRLIVFANFVRAPLPPLFLTTFSARRLRLTSLKCVAFKVHDVCYCTVSAAPQTACHTLVST